MTEEHTTDRPENPSGQAPSCPSYWGSVRFFKHLILCTTALLIVVPSALALVYGAKSRELSSTVKQLRADMEAQSAIYTFDDRSGDASASDSAASAPLPEVETPAWQELYPELYAQETQRSSVDEAGTVYLTFDDGPSIQTPKILEILARYNVKATFFVVGKTDEQSRQWMRDIVAAGHTLGMHSYSHEMTQIYGSVELFLEDFQRIYQLIEETAGVAPQIFRFPGGSINGYNAATSKEIIAEMVRRGFVYFDWNVATGDAAKSAVEPSVLTQNALNNVSQLRRAVVLMHDSAARATTVAALPGIIQGYQDAGFTFAPLTAEVKPVIYSYPK